MEHSSRVEVEAGPEYDEVVTSESVRPRWSGRLADDLRNECEQRVTGAMAQEMIHVGEVVEVEDRDIPDRTLCERALEIKEARPAVEEPGQRVASEVILGSRVRSKLHSR